MTCPNCNGETIVTKSRCHDDYTERRKKCVRCGYRFSTIEIDSDMYERIIRSNDKKRNP